MVPGKREPTARPVRPTRPTRSTRSGAPPGGHRRQAIQPSNAEPGSAPDPTLASFLGSLSPVLATEGQAKKRKVRFAEQREPVPTARRSKRPRVRQEPPSESEVKRLTKLYSERDLADKLRSAHQPHSYPSLEQCDEGRCATCQCQFAQLRSQDLHDKDRFRAALEHLMEISTAKVAHYREPITEHFNCRDDTLHAICIGRFCKSLNSSRMTMPTPHQAVASTRKRPRSHS